MIAAFAAGILILLAYNLETQELSAYYPAVYLLAFGIGGNVKAQYGSKKPLMGEGADVALETADIILMKNDLSRIAYSIRLVKKMQRIVKKNIFFSLASSLY